MADSSNKRKRTSSVEDVLQHSCHDEDFLDSRPNKKERKQKTPLEDIDPLPPVPSTSRHLPIAIGGSHWRDYRSFENIVVMGDSYSKSNDSKTWVSYIRRDANFDLFNYTIIKADHLTRRLEKKYKQPQTYNFAFPGATAEHDLSSQLTRFFTSFPKKDSPKSAPLLNPDSTTYLLFFGINDCGSNDSDDLETIVETVFDAIHDLYVKAGARNFIIVDVPPVDRSPQALDSESSAEMEERVRTWNDLLRTQATEFGTSSKEATVLLFSSHQVLMEVLEDPCEFGFSEDDPDTEAAGIWEDDLHLTTDVHDHLAERLLGSVISS
ncbi:hypothetical protein DENSPDRAFT_871282 [Dentipellis sp. KUC8613]|nr:hypothetical protein DENSPDRAFT_871282 [Dentipellis sp. KUC8613]